MSIDATDRVTTINITYNATKQAFFLWWRAIGDEETYGSRVSMRRYARLSGLSRLRATHGAALTLDTPRLRRYALWAYAPYSMWLSAPNVIRKQQLMDKHRITIAKHQSNLSLLKIGKRCAKFKSDVHLTCIHNFTVL